MTQAEEKYGLRSPTIWRLVDEGKLRVGLGPPIGRDRHLILVPERSLVRHVKATTTKNLPRTPGEAPPDGVPVDRLAGTGNRGRHDENMVQVGSPPGPRPAHSERHGPICDRRRDRLSTALARFACFTGRWRHLRYVYRNPVNRSRPIPGNPGHWIGEGIFQHDTGSLFFTERYIRQHRSRYGLFKGELHNPKYQGPPSARRIVMLTVTWPGACCPQLGAWKVTVFAKESLDRLVQRRSGKIDGGELLTPSEIWTDAEGLWYSSTWIAERKKCNPKQVHKLRELGALTRMKLVPTVNQKGKPSAPVMVHHESEVRPLLGIGGGFVSRSPAGPADPRRGAVAGVTQTCFGNCSSAGNTRPTERRWQK